MSVAISRSYSPFRAYLASYNGEVLSSAPIDEPCISVVDIDINLARSKKLNEFNDVLEDRNPTLYFNDMKNS